MESDIRRNRAYVIALIFFVVTVSIVIRLLDLQILDDKWKLSAENNVVRKVVTYPARGLVYDRNMELLVYNQAAYDFLATPREIQEFDTLSLCSILGIEKSTLINGLKKAKRYSRYKPSVILKQLSANRYASLQEQLYKFPGFYVRSRTLRQYPFPIAAQTLGYVGEVNTRNIKKDAYYTSGDYIGKRGIEYTYEKELRGKKGVSYRLVDVHSRIKGEFKRGKYDTTAVTGSNLISTLDAKLQRYGEELMAGKAGAIVALEPKTGEILSVVSAPTFDPGLLVGRVRSVNYQELQKDPNEPLYNRTVSAAYPPGSTFKLVNGLIALQEGVITPQTKFVCHGRSTRPIMCTHNHVNPISIVPAIRESCNPFFWQTFKACLSKYSSTKKGYIEWANYVKRFGLGQNIAADIIGANGGNVPSANYYDKVYRGSWNSLTVRSLAIGQGELLCTPLQMANVAATIANKGYYISPHIIKKEVTPQGKEKILKFDRHETGIDTTYYNYTTKGLREVILNGTARVAYIDSVKIVGKTGTIQNPSGVDHSAFIAFAPMNDPKIAIFVYVERGVWGSRYAAPIASLMVEKYLKGYISPRRHYLEKKMKESVLLVKEEKIEENNEAN
ncbi:penicillin-binding protein 2 [Halosquirtibacter laminarini]|uniref:Penicillin-binding protein 2 n=1 Tax=Halosquirtibacter laminarini TaxID=3374600 RepID=A0AC61NFU3_9BACT|nr:penicillin-binding protein 2 [Prolixibacteraceae bacterium]